MFLAHSSADKAGVRALFDRLAADGFAPWLDKEVLQGGENWRLAIRQAVRASHFVVVCLSNASTKRHGYMHEEIKQALDVAAQQPEGAIFVIPLRLERCDVPDRLRDLHHLDLFEETGYSRLIRAMRSAG